jgi:CDP-diacylglycerol---glycerol-3-phosphate 3-phosphatidyltransferase
MGVSARPAVAKVVAPLIGRLARSRVTPDAITIVGTLGAVAGSVGLIATGHLFWGAFTVTVFVLLDMLDGALARAR